MVTKGIITSIDFNGNTCQVRIPLFETAGNDPITGTAIVSNTPGSYNGYKVGDVVLVAFEDGKMQNPVIVGKLYLGAAKEKQDPRGTINVETTTASKSASLPADAVLTANVDSNVPNTNTPFGSLASIANNLNSLNTDVNQLDRFTRNQFNSIITDVNDQGEQLRSEIKQTASNIEANVVHTHKDGSQDALGWDLTTDSWKINAQDTVNGKVKDINIVTIDRSGMTLSGDLKLNGYPKNITVLYVRIDPNAELPQLYEFKPVDFPETYPETPIDNAWYYGKYIQITEAETGKEKYVLILKENFEYYNKLEQLKPGETIAYNREIASDWSTTVPERVDGQYIWQWTHTEIYSFDEVNNIWNEKDDDKVVCITGADGKDGVNGKDGKDGKDGTPATTYWAKISTSVHKGKNQDSNIEITPYAKIGDSPETIDTTAYFKYSLDNGTNWNSDGWTAVTDKIVISAGSVEANDIIVKLAHAYTDPDTHKNIFTEYETETITYSPLNTPIIDLNNDTDVIKYKPNGTKITADVSSTAQVYLGGSPEDATYKWSCNPDGGATFMGENTKTITVTGLSSNKVILTCTATTTNFKDENGNGVAITKDFIVSKEVVVASYWLSFSPVHTGNLQTTNIEVKALAKIGNDSESLDNNAYLRYRWDNGNSWSGWNNNATLIIEPASIQNSNLRIQATHDSAGDNRQVYEDETITYSPLNTPVLDLTNDSAAIAYDGNVKLGNSVSSTAVVYLNGSVISGCTFAWTATDCTIGDNKTATVTVSAIDNNKHEGTVTCKVTGIPNYPNIELAKVFTIAKQYKGDQGTPGKDGQDGAPGKDGTPGAAGYNTATVLLYKRKTKSESVPTINWTNDLTYTFATHSLSSVPSGWSTTIPAPVANDGGLYVTVAIAYSNTGTDTIPSTEWTIPSLYVENGEDGNDSTSYWLKLSSPIHLGVNQKSDITISPMSQTGTEGEKQDTTFIRYYFEGETTPNWPSSASTLITIPKEDLINKNLVVEATHSASGTPYANETITYSSLTSPTMDLSRDSGAINYDSDGMTKTGSDISSTATVYLGETEYSGATSFSWTLSPNGYANSDYEISGDKKTITIKNCWADTVSATCTAICTGRSGTVLVPTLKPLYKKEKYKVDSGVKKVLVEGADKPYWEWTASGATQKVALTNTEIKQQYITLEKTFTVTKQIKGDQGEGGVSVATVQLFKRSSNAITTKPVSTDSNYWTYYFTGANAGKAVLTGTDSIWGDCSSSIPAGSDPVYETHAAVITMPGETSAKIINWSTPAKFVENGAAGVSIIQNKQWYILWPADNKNGPGKPDAANKLDKPDATPTTLRMWIPIPPEAVNDYVVWTCYESIFSDGHSKYSDPVKDNAYALAQGKTTNYYSDTDPAKKYSIKKGDCWFDTGYAKIGPQETKAGYLGKFVICSSSVSGSIRVEADGSDRCIPSTNGPGYLVKVTPDNIDTLISNHTIVVGTADAYETGNLKQCSGFDTDNKAIWEDIAGELVTNKLTANYINAMDITAKKITVLDKADSSKKLFEADGINGNGEVNIGGFTVDSNRLYIGAPGKNDSIELSSIHNLIAYKSTNERTASSYAFVKIIVNNDTNLTVYIRSDATKYPDDNYMMVSTPNAAPYPDYYTDSRVKEHTCGQPNTGKNLNDYTRVEYCGLKKGDYILVIYKRGEIATDATDAGYFLIPDTPDITVSGVSSQFSFTKDSSLDINGVAGASLKIGSNFSVDYTGAIKSTSGTIGNFKVSPYGLTFGKDDSTRQFSLKNFTTQLQAYTSKQSIPHNSDNTAVMKVTIKKDSAYFKLFVDSLCSYGLEASHYIIISNLNTESIPTDWTDGGVYYTNADNLYFTNYSDDDYISHETVYGKVDNAVPVVFKNVKENDYFYIIFKLKQSNDPGYGHTVNSQAIVFIPNNNTCIVSNVSGEYNWIRNSTKDTTIENTTLDIGSKFNVTDDGTLMARTGLFGPWMLTSEKLAYNYNDYLYSSKYKPYLTEVGNNKKKYASAYRYNNAAYWNGDGLILSTKKTLEKATTGWEDYFGPKDVTVGTEISAGGGVESTRIVRKLWSDRLKNGIPNFKGFPVICNINNPVTISSNDGSAVNGKKSVITTVDAICTIKVDSNSGNWTKLPRSAYANIVPFFGFIVNTNVNDYATISTAGVRIKTRNVANNGETYMTEVEYTLAGSDKHGTVVLFGKATGGLVGDN